LIKIEAMRLLCLIIFVGIIGLSSCKPRKAAVSSDSEVVATATAEEVNLWALGIDTTQAYGTGLQKGDVVPMFEGMDQFKQTVNTNSLLEEGDLVMVFFRGQWCGYCTQHLTSLQDSLEMIQGKGANVIAITPESFESSILSASKAKVKFPIVADLPKFILDGYQVSFAVNEDYQDKLQQYAKIDLETSQPKAGNSLPVPAVYIVGSDKRVKFSYFDPDYSKRLSVREILEQL